jgi:hypothetical protein
MRACATQDIMVGDDCAAQRHNLEVSYPVSNGAARVRRRRARLRCTQRNALKQRAQACAHNRAAWRVQAS